MKKRYCIVTDSILEGCLVTPDVYKNILARFETFVAPFIAHLHKRVQQRKAYVIGLNLFQTFENAQILAV